MIRAKSDNSATQYKSKPVFQFWHSLAREQNKLLSCTMVYPATVDAMHVFGAKTPLRRAVVTEDFNYRCAADIQRFLLQKFQHDDQKHYFTIEPSIMEKLHENGKFFKIKDCQQQHDIILP